MSGELALGQTRAIMREGECVQRPAQRAIAPCRHRQNELQFALRGARDGRKFGDIVQAQQAAISDNDHALDVEAFEHRRQHRLQRLCLRYVAGMHRVHQRQTFGRLHHAEHELTFNAASFLVHAERTHIVGDLAFAVNANRRQVIEHHRQLLIEHRTQLRRDARFNGFGVTHQRVHRAQQLIVRDAIGHARNRHRLQPFQTAELRIRCAQTIEHHRTHQGFGIK